MDESAAAAASLSIGEALPFLGTTFGYTDKVCALIPWELFDWRPPDPSGAYQFSIGELFMHIADERHEFGALLDGEAEPEYFMLDTGWKTGEPWSFRRPESFAPVLEMLLSGHERLKRWLRRPSSELLQTTETSRAVFEERLVKIREAGREPSAELLARGPETIGGALMFACAHEAAHRGLLQNLLRQHGVEASFKKLQVDR